MKSSPNIFVNSNSDFILKTQIISPILLVLLLFLFKSSFKNIEIIATIITIIKITIEIINDKTNFLFFLKKLSLGIKSEFTSFNPTTEPSSFIFY